MSQKPIDIRSAAVAIDRAAPLESGLVSVNGLDLYYEIHGSGETPPSSGGGLGGEPLVLLHGGLLTIDQVAPVVAELAQDRQVIAVELEGHGRTPLRGDPLSYEQMADDIAALVALLGLAPADLFGWSLGGGVAWQIAIRHPKTIRKLVVASAPFRHDGWAPPIREGTAGLNAEAAAAMLETPLYQSYVRVAPRPEDWPELVTRVGQLASGGVVGDLEPLPSAQLAVLPGTAHSALFSRTDLLVPIVESFLASPLPDAG